MTIYSLEDDFREPIRWYLRVPTDSANQDLTWAFNTARHARPMTPLRTKIRREGRRVDFTFAAFDIPIVNQAARSVFESHASECVEFFPIRVQEESDDYFIMNILVEADCLDEKASDIQWWTETDGRRDRAGSYRMLSKAVYDASITSLPPIFRLSKFHVRVIVTDKLRKVIDDAALTGLVCKEIVSNRVD